MQYLLFTIDWRFLMKERTKNNKKITQPRSTNFKNQFPRWPNHWIFDFFVFPGNIRGGKPLKFCSTLGNDFAWKWNRLVYSCTAGVQLYSWCTVVQMLCSGTADVQLYSFCTVVQLVRSCTASAQLYSCCTAVQMLYSCLAALQLYSWCTVVELLYRCTAGVQLCNWCTAV